MRICIAIVAAVALASLVAPASAHHSFAMFDETKSLTLEGTVKELQWTNPHIWVQMIVKDAAGREVEWSIEGGSPNGLSRQGWRRTSIKPGDRIVMITHPLKNGQPGGSLVEARVNGTKIGT